jgi:cadmium resistance transport/sequestration family protein
MTLLTTIFTAVLTFTATNVDDIFLLMMFFSQTNHLFRRRHVVAGQYLGFVALMAVSLLGFAGRFIMPREFIGLLGLAPIVIGLRKLFEKERQIAPVDLSAQRTPSRLQVFLHPKTHGVAAVTFANGGDNIGIYTPLFASLDPPGLILTATVFLVLVAVWCLLALRLTHQKHVAQVLFRYGHWIVPVVLIGLGIFLLLENGTLYLLI